MTFNKFNISISQRNFPNATLEDQIELMQNEWNNQFETRLKTPPQINVPRFPIHNTLQTARLFLIAATAVVVNIIITVFFSDNKSNKTSISMGSTNQNKNICSILTSVVRLHVFIYFSNDKSKKIAKIWNDPWCYRYTLYDPCPVHSSHLSLCPPFNECIRRVQRQASCLMFHRVISLLLSITKTQQQPNSFFKKAPHTHFCLLQVDIDRYPSLSSLNLH